MNATVVCHKCGRVYDVESGHECEEKAMTTPTPETPEYTPNEGRTLLAFGGILIAIVVLACAGMTLLACAGMYAWDRPACHQWAAINNVPAQWHLRTGCLVQMQDGVWYGVENVRWVGLAP